MPFLESLKQEAASLGFAERIEAVDANMVELPFSDESFDLIWSEGNACIMGFEKAMRAWKPLIANDVYLFVSDIVLLTDRPSLECAQFWKTEYPEISIPQ